MAISSKKIQPPLFKDLWITSGIFSSHYLLERLLQIVHELYGLMEEEIRVVEGKG